MSQPEEMIIKECKRCGAPLKRFEGDMICEYCGAQYERHQGYQCSSKPSEQVISSLPQPQPAHPRETPLEPPQKKKGPGLFAVFFIIAGLAVCIFSMRPTFLDALVNEDAGNSSPYAKIEKRMHRENSGLGPGVENPVHFLHEETFSYGMFYNGGDDEDFQLTMIVENQQDLPINQDLKADHMELERVVVSDNNGLIYDCEVQGNSQRELKPDQPSTLARIYCSPILSPEVKYLDVETVLSNWGAKDFQIPITLDIDALDIYYLIDRGPESASMRINFYADTPQNVELYYDDIVLMDGKGKAIPLEKCMSQSAVFDNNYEYFSLLTSSGNTWIDCWLSQPIGETVNSVTLVLTIRGQTVSMTVPVDTISGTIKYDSRNK